MVHLLLIIDSTLKPSINYKLMKQKIYSLFIVFFILTNVSMGQFIAKDINFAANSITNDGKISG